MLASPLVMRLRTFLFITALLPCHLYLLPQTLTKQVPPPDAGPAAASGNAAQTSSGSTDAASSGTSLPAAPAEASDYPIAEVLPAAPSGVPVRLEYEHMEK